MHDCPKSALYDNGCTVCDARNGLADLMNGNDSPPPWVDATNPAELQQWVEDTAIDLLRSIRRDMNPPDPVPYLHATYCPGPLLCNCY